MMFSHHKQFHLVPM